MIANKLKPQSWYFNCQAKETDDSARRGAPGR